MAPKPCMAYATVAAATAQLFIHDEPKNPSRRLVNSVYDRNRGEKLPKYG